MAFTYTTLKQAIQDYVVSDEGTLITNLPIIVKQAEDRILNNAQLPNFRKNVIGRFSIGNKYLAIPADFIAPYSLAWYPVTTEQYTYLIFKEASFIYAAYPDATVTGDPKYYAIFDDNFFLIGPTSSGKPSAELRYFYRPASIVDASTSWLGTNAESCLLYGCLLEAYTFQKGDPDVMEIYEKRYKEALQSLKVIAEGRNKTDSYRNG